MVSQSVSKHMAIVLIMDEYSLTSPSQSPAGRLELVVPAATYPFYLRVLQRYSFGTVRFVERMDEPCADVWAVKPVLVWPVSWAYRLASYLPLVGRKYYVIRVREDDHGWIASWLGARTETRGRGRGDLCCDVSWHRMAMRDASKGFPECL